VAQMMMSLSKWWCGQSSTGEADKTGRCNRRKTKLVKLPKAMWTTMTRVSANQVTSVMILNIANIKIKNNMIIMVSDLPNKYKLHGQIRNKRNIRDMKRVREKSALSKNRKRRSIDGMNNIMAVRRT
jgi:hypothetical protein